MMPRDRLDLRITDLLDEMAPPRTPAYAESIVEYARSTSQRPRWSFASGWMPSWLALPPIPANGVALALLAVLLLVALAVASIVGSPRRLPPPFGPAGNGVILIDDGSGIRGVTQTGQAAAIFRSSAAGDGRPAFSLDGQRIAFFREVEGARTVVVASADGGAAREVVRTDTPPPGPQLWSEPPVWSPDGRHVAVTVLVGPSGDEDSQIWIVDVETMQRSVLLPAGFAAVETPVWAPDGEHLAFLGSPRHGGVAYLYMARRDGTGLVQLSQRESSGAAGYFGPYRWSPDGTRIATDYGGVASARFVLLIDVATRREEKLNPDGRDASHASWSADGRSVAYWRQTALHEDAWQVVVVDLATRREVLLPHVNASAESIVWAPDGTALTAADCAAGTCRLLLLDVANPPRAPTTLAEIPARSLDQSIESAYWSWQRIAK